MSDLEDRTRETLITRLKLDPQQLTEVSTQILKAGHMVRFRAVGESMKPTIMEGDLLTVSPIENRKASLGQIVMFVNSSGRSLVHRIVSIKKVNGKRVVQTCGDNASLRDKAINDAQIIGIIYQASREGMRVDGCPISNLFQRCWYLLRASRIR
jgi:phage repressor protein C with HTH and peptisase S24 domain